MLSLLNCSEASGIIPYSVFADVGLDKLFTDNAIKVLSLPCCREDILARQEIFRLMENEDFYEWFSALFMSLKVLDRARYMIDSAAHEVEYCALFYTYANAYVTAIENTDNDFDAVLLRTLKGQMNAYFQSLAFLKERLSKYCELLSGISDISLRLGSGGISVKHCSDSGKASICDSIYAAAEKIGYSSVGGISGRAFKMSPQLADAIVKLNAESFKQIADLRNEISSHIDFGILSIIGDIDFYFAVNNLRKKAEQLGTPSCYANISDIPEYRAEGLYDISLFQKDCKRIIPNDIDLREGDSVYFIRGANGGGKTTYIRAVTINLLLFLGGCPVFGENASIYPFRNVFTHFPENEGFAAGGRLENEEKRLDEVIENADRDSFLLLNETFSGADEKKGTELSLNLMKTLKEKGAFCLFVTHFHNISESDIPSLTTVVDITNDNARTYRIVKSRDIKSSYAADILKKHGLDHISLQGRIENA